MIFWLSVYFVSLSSFFSLAFNAIALFKAILLIIDCFICAICSEVRSFCVNPLENRFFSNSLLTSCSYTFIFLSDDSNNTLPLFPQDKANMHNVVKIPILSLLFIL